MAETVQFSTTSSSTNEGNSGSQTVTATAQLSAAATSTVTIPITYSGTATSGSDYTPGSSTITIAAGSLTGTTSFTVLGDTTIEANETVVLAMGVPITSPRNYTTNIVNWGGELTVFNGSSGSDSITAVNHDSLHNITINAGAGDDFLQWTGGYQITFDGGSGFDTLDLTNTVSRVVVTDQAFGSGYIEYPFGSPTIFKQAFFTGIEKISYYDQPSSSWSLGNLLFSSAGTISTTLGTNTTYTHTIVNEDTVGNPPTIVSPLVDRVAFEGQSVLISLPASLFVDNDLGDSITISATGLPNWLTFTSASGTAAAKITGVVPTQANGTVAPVSITVTANDMHGGSTSDSFVLTALDSFTSQGAASLYLSDPLDVLAGYFSGDAVAAANQLIADKVGVALDIFNSSTAPLTEVYATDKITATYAPNPTASWAGAARMVINGTGLSSDPYDQNYSISSIDFLLTDSASPNNWDNPLAKVSLGLVLNVSGGEATSFGLNSILVQAGDAKVSFVGPINFIEGLTNTISMPTGRLEVQYDSDPGPQTVLSTLYLEGGLSLVDPDGAGPQSATVSGVINGLGAINDAGHYFYGTNLNITTQELDALPDNYTPTQLARAIFQSSSDTVYTKTAITMPEGFENLVIQGTGAVAIDGNTQSNSITGNSGNNTVNGGLGTDTFITSGTFDQSTGVLNRDGSISLTSPGGGTDRLSTVL